MFLDQRFALASEVLGGDRTGFNHFSEASSTRTPFANEYSAGGELQAVDDNTKDAICGMEGIISNDELVSGVGSFSLMSTQEDSGQIPTRTNHLDLVSQYDGLVGASLTEAMDVDVDWPIDTCAPTESHATLARRSPNCADWAWTMSPEYCPDIQQNGDDWIANMMEHMDLQPLFESPMLTIAALQVPYSSGLPSISPDNIMHGLETDAVAADTIPSVESLLTCLLLIRCNSIALDVLRYSWEMEIFRQASLEVPIDEDRLMIEIEDLLRWIVSSCQRAVAQGQVDKETFDGHALLSIPVNQSNLRDRPFPANQTATRGETLIEALKFRAVGMFTIELRIAGSGRYPVGSDVITVCSIPQDQQRTLGLIASFALNSSPFRARISPHIRTFNVIPTRSPIIECVKKNDLEGVQKLFAEGQASPLDVDPKGNSLLQVSETHFSGNAQTDSSLSTPCSEVTLLYSDCFSIMELASKHLGGL